MLPFSTRTIGIIFTVIGFSLAILAGLVLAAQVNTLGTDGLLIASIIAFVITSVPLLSGLYLYARSATAQQELNIEMIKQRELMDFLKAHSQTNFAQLAEQLKIPEAEIRDIVTSLGELQVFTGYITPTGIVHQLEPAVLLALTQCQQCGTAIKIQTTTALCAACGTTYYPPESPNKWWQVSG